MNPRDLCKMWLELVQRGTLHLSNPMGREGTPAMSTRSAPHCSMLLRSGGPSRTVTRMESRLPSIKVLFLRHVTASRQLGIAHYDSVRYST